MELTHRQKEILKIVKEEEPVTSQELARRLNLTRAALRTDLALLTMARLLEAKPRVGYFHNPQNSPVWLSNLLWGTGVEEVQGVPVVINEESTIHNAAVNLFLEDAETLFVVDEKNRPAGLVTAKDLIKVMLGGSENRELPVKVAMVRLPNEQKLKIEDNLYRALLLLQDGSREAVPVVDNNHSLVGRVTRQGVFRFLLTNLSREGE